MAVINLPPMLRTIFDGLESRIRKLELNPFRATNMVSDPTILADGMVWYRTSDHKFMTQDNGVVRPLGESKYWAAIGDTSASVTAASSASVYSVPLNTLAAGNGFSIVDGYKVVPAYTSVYQINISIQFQNSSATAYDVAVWLAIDGLDIANTASRVTVPPKHGSTNGAALLTVPYVINITAGHWFEFRWWAENVAAFIVTIPAVTSPPIPANPGVILTVSQSAW